MTRSVPPRLVPGDHVRLVSPASTPKRENVDALTALLSNWGLVVELGDHVFDEHGFLAGTDADRLADLNDAFRDPQVRAVVTTAGGAGAYRIAAELDFDAVRRDPKPLTGYSDITSLHLAIWRAAGVPGLHGGYVGDVPAEAMRRALMTAEPIVLTRRPADLSAAVRVPGQAAGVLVGGNLGQLVYAVGAGLPSLDGAILFFESFVGGGAAMLDRLFFQLIESGALDGVRGVAIGHLTENPHAVRGDEPDGWTVVELLQERLGALGVPVLGGLPLGHDPDPLTVPLGTMATLDASAGVLTVQAGVR
jgi:muramoyltetrapeptide carboxypeptidase